MNRFWKSKKAFLMAAVGMLVLVIVIGGTSLALNTRAHQLNRFTQEAAKQQSILATSVSQSVVSEIDDDVHYLQLATDFSEIKSGSTASCGAKLKELLTKAPSDFVRLDRLSLSGDISCSTDSALIGQPSKNMGYAGEIFTDPNHQPLMSRYTKVSGIDGPVTFLEVPITGPQGQFLGVVSGAISMRDLQKRVLDNAKVSDQSSVSLVDNNGDFLALSNHASEGKNYTDQSIKNMIGADYPKVRDQIDKALMGHGGVIFFKTSTQDKVVAIYPVMILPNHSWALSVGQSVADIAIASDDAINRQLVVRSFIAFLLLVSLAGWLIVLYIIKSVIEPIEKTTAIAELIGQGDLEQRLPYRGDDEIGRLAKAFNAMAHKLREYYGEMNSSVNVKTEELNRRLAEFEKNNQTLEDTKKAVLNILDDLSEEKAKVETEKIKDEALIDSIGEGLIFTNEYGNVISVNPVALELLGNKAEDLMDKWFPSAIVALDAKGQPIDPKDRLITRALLTGEIVTGDVFYRRKDGSSFPAFVTVSPVLVEGKPVGAVEVFRDVTKERELEKAKEEFVSLASHQLRTPATGVKAFTSMLMDGYAGKLTAKQSEFLAKAIDSNERQLHIIDDMLNVARADSGRMVLVPAEFDIASLIEDIVTEQKPTIEERHQTVKLTKPEGKLMIKADASKIRMAIENLVSNASKYTPEHGAVEVSLQKVNNTAIITVKDNGVGIAKADMGKLFQKFARLDNKLSALVGGTGLGLYLVKKIIELHKGKIKTESVLGKGTTFTVELPLKG